MGATICVRTALALSGSLFDRTQKKIAALGMPLVVRIGDVCAVLADLQKQFDLQSFMRRGSSNGWTYERDKRVLNWCRDNKILFHEFPSNGVVSHVLPIVINGHLNVTAAWRRR